jgi:hypothetical protein
MSLVGSVFPLQQRIPWKDSGTCRPRSIWPHRGSWEYKQCSRHTGCDELWRTCMEIRSRVQPWFTHEIICSVMMPSMIRIFVSMEGWLASHGQCEQFALAIPAQHGVEWHVLQHTSRYPRNAFAYMQLSKQLMAVAFLKHTGIAHAHEKVHGSLAHLGNADHPPEW